ncbi:uncharacterized protein [Amphiura filiformis]|uniref:uncharacterized protein n=1 Tax=Amphiura filiformis TaxID=82378 RepID=UPI003B215D97
MHNSREFFKAAKNFDRKTATRNSNIKDKDGKLLTQSAEIKGRWREFAEELYENTDHDPPPIIEVNPSTSEPSILLEEIEQAISKLGNNKSPGIDGIPAELLKASGTAGRQMLWNICNRIWETGEWPEDWVSSVFITIPKI